MSYYRFKSIFFFTKEPPRNLNELFLADKMENLADIYVIGTQESYSETMEWEISIQETIGPTHVLFHSETLGTIYLGIFIRRELIWYCSCKYEYHLYTVFNFVFKVIL